MGHGWHLTEFIFACGITAEMVERSGCQKRCSGPEHAGSKREGSAEMAAVSPVHTQPRPQCSSVRFVALATSPKRIGGC